MCRVGDLSTLLKLSVFIAWPMVGLLHVHTHTLVGLWHSCGHSSAMETTLVLSSWIKRDKLDATWFIISLFNAQHVSDINTFILRSFRLICSVVSWVVLLWFDACWCYVVVWLHPDTTPLQPNHNVTPTHIESEQYNPWNNSTNKSQAPEGGCINIRNMLSIK